MYYLKFEPRSNSWVCICYIIHIWTSIFKTGILLGTSGEYVYGARLAIRVTYQICPRISRLSLLMTGSLIFTSAACAMQELLVIMNTNYQISKVMFPNGFYLRFIMKLDIDKCDIHSFIRRGRKRRRSPKNIQFWDHCRQHLVHHYIDIFPFFFIHFLLLHLLFLRLMLLKCFTLAKLNIMINFQIINFHINISNIINFFIATASGRQTFCLLCHLIQALC